jgi:dTMP kinase
VGGRLLVFEGPEGAGKSTQIARLAKALRAQETPHLVVREPGGTPTGERVRALLLDPAHEMHPATEALLFLASRAELITRVIKPALAEGKLVIADRFFLSTYAYQVGGRGLPEASVRAANTLATDGLVPDLTVLLLHHAAEGLARADRRGARDRMESADNEFHERVTASFAHFETPAWQTAHPECGPIVGIDATPPEGVVFASLLTVLGRRWPETFTATRGSDQR